MTTTPSPRISIVIPVFNEEAILRSSVLALRERLESTGWKYELLLAENGSLDRTAAISTGLAAEFPEVSAFSFPEPDYGRALREGIRKARGEIVICEEIDLCDVEFHRLAVDLIEGRDAEMVVGSKRAKGARDTRPWPRRFATYSYTALLRVLLGFRGSDTHGLKAFRRERLLPIADECMEDGDVFASELVIRAWRGGVAVREVPIRVVEVRPTAVPLIRRIPHALKSVARLTWAIRFAGSCHR